jgi:hypothetical protein
VQNESLEARCAADCEHLLGRVTRRFRRDFQVPAEVVREAIVVSGFRIEVEEMEQDSELGYCDAEKRRVVILKDFGLRLNCPWVAHRVLNFTLAHELGHARLHADLHRAGGWEPHWEDEATFYARVFLVPRPMLMRRMEIQRLLDSRGALSTELWQHVLDLADVFLVSGKFMAHTLDAYGLIRFDPATRWIELPT